MEEWGRLYSNVRFLSVCVEAIGVAKEFDRIFRLTNAVNCQLGCSGYIVSDANGCFVRRKTKAYLDYVEAAFSHIEKLLLEHFDQRPQSIR
mmetsp:Transcript_2407/g.4208  ORF Transcript_2407/g.4208 Transcript_2407/m.4208 type:complete len:91 (+) Transcript_2407:702-974(+)